MVVDGSKFSRSLAFPQSPPIYNVQLILIFSGSCLSTSREHSSQFIREPRMIFLMVIPTRAQ